MTLWAETMLSKDMHMNLQWENVGPMWHARTYSRPYYNDFSNIFICNLLDKNSSSKFSHSYLQLKMNCGCMVRFSSLKLSFSFSCVVLNRIAMETKHCDIVSVQTCKWIVGA